MLCSFISSRRSPRLHQSSRLRFHPRRWRQLADSFSFGDWHQRVDAAACRWAGLNSCVGRPVIGRRAGTVKRTPLQFGVVATAGFRGSTRRGPGESGVRLRAFANVAAVGNLLQRANVVVVGILPLAVRRSQMMRPKSARDSEVFFVDVARPAVMSAVVYFDKVTSLTPSSNKSVSRG